MAHTFVWTGSALLLDNGQKCLSARDIETLYRAGGFTSDQIPIAIAIGLALEMTRNPGPKRLLDTRSRMVHIALAEGCTQDYLNAVYDELKEVFDQAAGKRDPGLAARVASVGKGIAKAMTPLVDH